MHVMLGHEQDPIFLMRPVCSAVPTNVNTVNGEHISDI